MKLFEVAPDKPLNKPFRTPGGPKKFSVYVKNESGNVVKVNFGDSTGLTIKRDQKDRRDAFRARHNCSDPGPKWKARYWSCKMWQASTSVSDVLKEDTDCCGDCATLNEMDAGERSAAEKSGKVLARDFKAWAKDRYKKQKPTFKQYLTDISKSPTWRNDWLGKFLDVVEKAFDKQMKIEIKKVSE